MPTPHNKENDMTHTYEKEALRFDSSPKTYKTVTHGQYRVTVLTSRLFRVEHDPNQTFEDRATKTIWHRMSTSPFETGVEGNRLSVRTAHWTLQVDSRLTPEEGIRLIDNATGKTRHVSSFSKGNLKGTARTLDMADGAIPLEDGFVSKDGIAIFDDAMSVVFEDGKIVGTNIDTHDLYIFAYGSDYAQAIRDFYTIAGRTPLIPKKVLGNWWSRYWSYDEEELKGVVDTFKTKDIPLSVLIIDMDWHITDVPAEIGGGWTGYTWNKSYFDNPEAMLKGFKDQGLMLSLNLHPADGIRPFDDCYDAVRTRMGIPDDQKPVIKFDLTDPKFVEAYFKDVHHPLERQGIDFWWIDWQQGMRSNIDNLDPLFILNHNHFMDGYNRFGEPYIIFSRYAGPGSHRYPVGFSGDSFTTWESLRFQPYFTATATNVGYGWWSHDIGGHQAGIQDRELMVRWVQYGIFSPIMRLHSTKSFYQRREPWRWDRESEGLMAEAMRLRHRLVPYLHTFNHVNSKGDLPLVRPLYYTWPKDKDSYHNPNQAMFGTELMIAPVTSRTVKGLGLSKERVWFPKGGWFDFFTGRHVKKDGVKTIHTPLDRFNVYAKPGAIVPMASDHKSGTDDLPDAMDIHIFPGQDNVFSLIEDHDGIVHETTFALNFSGHDMTLSITTDGHYPKPRAFNLKFRSIDPDAIVETGIPSKVSKETETNTTVVHLMWDGQDDLLIKVSSTGELVCDPYDMVKDVMETLDRLPLDTEVKNAVGYVFERNPDESRGWLSMEGTLSEKRKAIDALDVPGSVRTYLKSVIDMVR
jgi:alpha-glucosidase (family GH31 glycosyl hydrolase)